MTARLPFATCDVFTDRPFAGNPLAIVEDADALSAEQMQTIAREFNLSETIFVMAPRDPDNTARVRIFFPTDEVPFAGHPTIGCALHLAGRSGAGRILLEEEAGLVPVTIDDGLAEFTAPVRPTPTGADVPVELLAAALDLDTGLIGPHAPAVHTGGPAFLYVPVPDLSVLARARPIEPHWSTLMRACDVDSAYVYAPGRGCDWQARMFSPTAGIPEDPATGSASAILAAQLMQTDPLEDGQTVLHLAQGVEMGRPSQLRLTVVVADGELSEVRVAGRAVPISSGLISVPG